MVKINLRSITWDYTNIKKITELASSQSTAEFLKQSAQEIISKSIPQLPVNYKKRYTKATPLNQSIIATEPKIKKGKVNGVSYQGYSITIKPKKKEKYYYVVMSGKNTYHGKKVELKYQNPQAVPLAIENNYRDYCRSKLQPWFYDQIMKVVKDVGEGDD